MELIRQAAKCLVTDCAVLRELRRKEHWLLCHLHLDCFGLHQRAQLNLRHYHFLLAILFKEVAAALRAERLTLDRLLRT